MIKARIQEQLFAVLSQEPWSLSEKTQIVVEIPKHKDQGDFAINTAFRLAKSLRKAPKVIAEEMASSLNENAELSRVYEFHPLNGFINISLRVSHLYELATGIYDFKPKFQSLGGHICLEYVSANPTGPLHIGHGRWAVLGDVIKKLFEYTGQSFKSESYINDAGNQMNLFADSVSAAKAGRDIPEGGYHGHYIQDLAALDKDPVEAILDIQKETLESLGVEFDTWYSEKSLHASGAVEEILDVLKQKGVLYEQDSATWFRSTDYGDDKDRVLIKADGAKTYFLVDIAYHYDKIKRGFDSMINIWGADHHGYVARVRAAIEVLGAKELTFTVLIGQLVNLFRDGEPVRMSKRTGDMIALSEVVDEIGPDATRYFLAHKSADTPIDFDLELAKKKNSENPVFYIQYAHARICSLLRKVERPNLKESEIDLQFIEQERALAKLVALFYDEVWEATKQLAPYRLAQYAQQLAKTFHLFYEACPIKTAEPALQFTRLTLAKQAQRTLKEVLTLLGISAPEQM